MIKKMNITFTQVISTKFCIIYSKKQSYNKNKKQTFNKFNIFNLHLQ